MSKLRRMELCGLRSFGPDEGDKQSIRFNSPLTLIKGQNGCGKTTIIEALKFAITGDLPSGSSSGQSFVYDPKLAGSIETRGHVKLMVCNVTGDYLTVSKKMCVTQKANDKQEFRRLDSVISVGKAQVSQKCADVDGEMCRIMGVSKSVLNNVIFCHQEDSNWPLDEPKKLKEKFDDIFDSTRYNKCSELFTKYKKKIDENQKIFKLELDNYHDKKVFVEKKKSLLRDKEVKLEATESEIESVNSEFEPITARLREIEKIEENYRKLHNIVEMKKSELKSVEKQHEEIQKRIVEFVGSDEELHGKLESFESDLSQTNEKIKNIEQKKLVIERREGNLRSQINEQERNLGQLEATETQNESKIRDRNELITTFAQNFDIEIPAIRAGSSDFDVKAIIRTLEETLETKENSILELEHQCLEDEKLLQSEIDRLKENQIQLNEQIKSKTKQLSDFEVEFREVGRNIEELNSADDQLKLVESKLHRLERESQGLESSVDVTSLKGEIEAEKEEETKLDSRLTSVDKEIQTLQHYSSLQTELDMLKESSINKKTSLQKLKNKHEGSLSHIFPNGLPKSDLKYAIESYQRSQTQLVKSLTSDISEKQREVTKLETNLNAKRERLKELEEVVANSKRELSAYCKEEPLDEVVAVLSKNIERLQKEKGVYSSSTYMYQKFIQEFEKDKPCCPVCKRDVAEKEYVRTVIRDLSDKIKNFPSEQRKIENQLREKQNEYKKLLELKPMYQQMQKLTGSDIPALKKEIRNMESGLQTATDKLKHNHASIVEPQKNEEICTNMMGDATLIDQYQKDLGTLKEQISSLSSRIPRHDSLRTIQEALADQDSLKIDLRTTRNNLESLRTKLSQYNDRVQKQREKYNELITQQLAIKKNLQDKDHFFTKRTELEAKMKQLERELADMKVQLAPLNGNLRKAADKKQETVLRNKKRISAGRAIVTEMKKQVESIQAFQAAIREFNEKNIPERKRRTNDNIATFKNDLRKCSDEKQSLEKEMDEFKVLVTNSKVYHRELLDNIELRKKRTQVKDLQLEIKELGDKLGNDNIYEVRREYNRLLNKQESLSETKNRAQGKREELQESIADIKKELAQPQNVRAAYNYKRKFLEYELHKRAALDLKNFIKAIDWSMMRFHTQKMIQINHTIRDLWRSVYRGNDCDYIEIKTEDSKKGYSEKRKTFEYYVVQVKNGVEMRMRGRCSAGQRVLASLIIRIALAETFSVNCGILALDEPTTNLDRENIHSLSETLVDLIAQKRQQKNFQLLIITHDQEFVDKLTRVENMESYYVIERNQHGKSTISLHRV